MDATTFWNRVAVYNRATWPLQAIVVCGAIYLTVRAFASPGRTTDVWMKALLAFAFAWNGIVFFLVFVKNPISYAIGAPLFLAVSILFIVDVFASRTRFRLPAGGWARALTIAWLLLALLYPALGWPLGHIYPEVLLPLFPCPLTIFAIALVAAAAPGVDRKTFIALLPWGLLSLPKCFGALDCYEDCVLFASSVYGLVMLVRSWRSSKTTPRRPSDNWLLRRMMKLTGLEKRLINSPQHARETERTALALLEYVLLPTQPDCLELGCGQGALAQLLVERYDGRIVASDYDPAQLALAQERLAGLDGRIAFRIVDARNIPFEDASFDAVFSFGVLHHIPGGWRQAVAEIARVLRPGGWFVFTDLVVAPGAGRLLRRMLPRLDQLEEQALKQSLALNGLTLEHYTHDQRECMAVLGLMAYCTAVAHRPPQAIREATG
jgi:SAM-dependent methyltransferase